MKKNILLKKDYTAILVKTGIHVVFLFICMLLYMFLIHAPISEQLIDLYDTIESDFSILYEDSQNPEQNVQITFAGQLAIIFFLLTLYIALLFVLLILFKFCEERYLFIKKKLSKNQILRLVLSVGVSGLIFGFCTLISVYAYTREAILLPSVVLYTILIIILVLVWSLYLYIQSQFHRIISKKKLLFDQYILYTIFLCIVLLPIFIMQNHTGIVVSFLFFIGLQSIYSVYFAKGT